MGKDFGKTFKNLRLANNLTQQEVADDFLVTAKTVSKWENGIFEPELKTLEKIALYFNVSIDEITGFSPVAVKMPQLSKIEMQLLDAVKGMTDAELQYILGYIHGFRGTSTEN